MFRMDIKSSIKDYSLFIIEEFSNTLSNEYQNGDYLIIDKRIIELYGKNILGRKWDNNIIEIDATENQKSYLGLEPVIQQLIEKGFRKNNRLFAIGGGITQDVTAFIASIMYRGVEWLFFPTTLLAQGDSCIGSKTSINFGRYKNQLGNFYSPQKIFIDLTFLDTLEERDLTSGLGEMLHYFLVSGVDDFLRFKKEYRRARENKEVLKELLKRSLEIKKSYIEIDEFDKKERQVFNYGHSFGHAIESLTNYEIPHGVAVSIGMDMSNYISVQYGYQSNETRLEAKELLQQIWKGYTINNMNQVDFENALRKDKKNKGNLLGLILSNGPGKTFKEYKPLDEIFSSWLTTYFRDEFTES
ncbi:MAG: hypothetical protein NTX65_03490 [Ignavibacteriales bacterium]|nr:hypothetical protein [Ignavibacteriales bacterium]